MKPNRIVTLSCGVALAAIGIAACGDDEKSTGSGATTAGGGTLTVYSSLPLQGASRPQTTAMVNGIKLAHQGGGQQGRHVHGQVPVARRLPAQAGSWTPEAVSQNARKAAQDSSTAAYIGEFNSGASAVSIPILSDAKVPQISPANTAVGLTSDEPGADKGEPGEVLPVGLPQLRAHRPEGHDPGRRARDRHEGGRLHEGRDGQRQGGLRSGPGAQHRAGRQGADAEHPVQRGHRPEGGQLPLARVAGQGRRARTASCSAASRPTTRSRSSRTSRRRCPTPSSTAPTASPSPASPTRRRAASRRRSPRRSRSPSRRSTRPATRPRARRSSPTSRRSTAARTPTRTRSTATRRCASRSTRSSARAPASGRTSSRRCSPRRTARACSARTRSTRTVTRR